MYQPREEFKPQGVLNAMQGTPLSLERVTDILRRRWRSIALVTGVFVALALAYAFTATPYFTATSSILVDTRQSQLLNAPTSGDNTLIDTSYIDSQVEVIKSDDLLLSVAKKLQLDKDPTFLAPPPGVFSFITGQIHKVIADIVGSGPKQDISHQLVDTLGKNLKVARVTTTYVLDVNYTARSPGQAAQIANAITEAYLVGALEARYAAAKRAGEWAQSRSEELRQEATKADMAVQTFRAANGIVGTSHGLMSEQQLSDVNTQLVQARAATAEAKAKLDQINKLSPGDALQSTVSDTLNNPVITRLRSQYLDLATQYQRLSAMFGKQHQAVVDLSKKMAAIQSSIADEVKRVAESYDSDYQIAKSREESLSTSLDALVKQNSDTNEAQVRLRNLEGAADTYRTLYNNFLDKVQQSSQQGSFPITDARVIATALPPDIKSSPKTMLIAAGALVGGLLVGIGIAFGAEFLNSGYQNASDVEESVGLKSLGVLPSAKVPNEAALLRFVASSPFSRYAETIRGVKVAIDNLRLSSPVQVVGIASSLPREGKTTMAANLATLISLTGSRTLLIDADLRRRSLTLGLATDAQSGLLEALDKPDTANAHTVALSSGLHFMPAVWNASGVDPAAILGSSRMATLLGRLKQQYEYIIIDLAPLTPVNDARAMAHLLDGVVYAIKWHETARRAVQEALTSGEEVRDKVIGCVLTQADPAALRRTEVHRGQFYESYYINSGRG